MEADHSSIGVAMIEKYIGSLLALCGFLFFVSCVLFGCAVLDAVKRKVRKENADLASERDNIAKEREYAKYMFAAAQSALAGVRSGAELAIVGAYRQGKQIAHKPIVDDSSDTLPFIGSDIQHSSRVPLVRASEPGPKTPTSKRD